jgi:arginyl-tRNA synthetase
MAEQIAPTIDASKFHLIQSVTPGGDGYINFHLNFLEFSGFAIESIRDLDDEYGYLKASKPKRIIVEHTSVNPIHPIHIGQGRNPILGDALSRVLEAQGHTIFRHYYVDDVGRQSAVIAYGYAKLGKPQPEGKPDSFIGTIYTITSCILELHRLQKATERAKESVANLQLDDWTNVASDLKRRFPALFSSLLEAINKDKDPEAAVNELIRNYEAGDREAKQLIRSVCEICLEGFRDTLRRAGISIDSWDWESDFIWNGDVSRVLKQLRATPYVYQESGVLEFDAAKVARDLNLQDTLGAGADYELTPLTLVRADGTTLYTTRDIAYHLWKFQTADRVINVIGMEQTLPQLQLKLALGALGYQKYAKNLVHLAYNLIRLPGFRMSSRRGRYFTLDEVMNEAVQRAYTEVSKRSPHLGDEEKQKISEFVGIGAVKYALVEVDLTKPVVFTWDRVLDFEKNSAPYIQYSHARTRSILRKASREPANPDYSLLQTSIEHNLILRLSRFPEVFLDVATNLRPNVIADFANMLAATFNTFYTQIPVIKSKPLGLSDARLALVDATRIVIRNALTLLGIDAPDKM